MIVLILALVAVSLIYQHCGSCSVEALGRVLAEQRSWFNGMTDTATAIVRLNLQV